VTELVTPHLNNGKKALFNKKNQSRARGYWMNYLDNLLSSQCVSGKIKLNEVVDMLPIQGETGFQWPN